jgi:N-acetylneuraminic acid mutarotase
MSSLLHRRLTIPATALMILLFAAVALTQSPWKKAAPFPDPDEELYGVTVNGKMYVIGGFGGGRPRGIVDEYDPATDKWAKKKPMALPVHH